MKKMHPNDRGGGRGMRSIAFIVAVLVGLAVLFGTVGAGEASAASSCVKPSRSTLSYSMMRTSATVRVDNNRRLCRALPISYTRWSYDRAGHKWSQTAQRSGTTVIHPGQHKATVRVSDGCGQFDVYVGPPPKRGTVMVSSRRGWKQHFLSSYARGPRHSWHNDSWHRCPTTKSAPPKATQSVSCSGTVVRTVSNRVFHALKTAKVVMRSGSGVSTKFVKPGHRGVWVLHGRRKGEIEKLRVNGRLVSTMTVGKGCYTAPPPSGLSVRSGSSSYRLSVPRLGLHGSAINLVTTRGGALHMGESLRSAYMDRNGIMPGERGNAVVVGHSNHGGYGMFNHLDSLRSGDRVSIIRNGHTMSYVYATKAYMSDSAVVRLLQAPQTSNAGRKLVLITCALSHYDWARHQYRGKEVVTLTMK